MLVALLPRGRLWRLQSGSVTSLLFDACADELERLDERTADMLAESDPSNADELLPEYERELALSPVGTTDERRARVVARTIARPRFRPADFLTALSPLLGLAAEDLAVLERTHAMASSMGDDRVIFEFFIYRDPTLPGAWFLSSAQDLVDEIKPTHTAGYVIESIDFLCDDEYSLCDSDLLGA
jgi:hypothetical protein